MAWQRLVSTNASVYDTVALIIKTINEYSQHPAVKDVTAHISKTHPNDFLRGLFDFVCENVEYEADPNGHERIYTPMRLLREGKGDCKKMSTFISAVLKCKGIRNYLKIVSYNGEFYAHIYPIVPTGGSYVTMDPVNKCQYDTEVRHVKSEVYNLNGQKMNLSILGNVPKNDFSMEGIGCSIADLDTDLAGMAGPEAYINSLLGEDDGMGKKKTKQQKQEKKQAKKENKSAKKQKKASKPKLKDKLKQVGIAPARNAMLALIKVNFAGWAKKLVPAWNKGPQLQNFWKNIGGDPAILKKNIIQGSKMQLNGMGVAPAVAIAVAAAPVAVALLKFLKDNKVISEETAADLEDKVVTATRPPKEGGGGSEGGGGGGGGDAESVEDAGGEDPGPAAGSFAFSGCWNNPISIAMNTLRACFICGADNYTNGPLTQLYNAITNLF